MDRRFDQIERRMATREELASLRSDTEAGFRAVDHKLNLVLEDSKLMKASLVTTSAGLRALNEGRANVKPTQPPDGGCFLKFRLGTSNASSASALRGLNWHAKDMRRV
jgi:hypothetical protein